MIRIPTENFLLSVMLPAAILAPLIVTSLLGNFAGFIVASIVRR